MGAEGEDDVLEDVCLIKRALNHAINEQLIQFEGCWARHRNLRQVDLHHPHRLPPANRQPKIRVPLGCEVPLQPLRQIRHACAAEAALKLTGKLVELGRVTCPRALRR